MVDFNSKLKSAEAIQEYTNVGRFLGHKVEDNDKLAVKGLVIIEDKGYELALFYTADKDIEYAEANGYEPPFASGSVKNSKGVVFWVKAYRGLVGGSVALKLQLTKASDKTEKLNLNLFYVKGSDILLEGNVSAKAPF